MEDLFRSYWWLLFPLGWMGFGAFTSFLNYRRQQQTLDLLKTYAEKGQEPPAALLQVLEKPIDSETEFWGSGAKSGQGDRGMWFSVILFGVMAAGFGYIAWADMYGAGDAFLIVTIVMSALFLACLASALMSRRRKPS